MSDGGKGSAPRPFSVGHDTFAKQFEAIFGKKNENSPSTERTVAESGSQTGEESLGLEENGSKDKI
ncbi:MAG: hypothetical protein RL018_1241 [Pseudomonadota bacterium]|jgi:hypothetical protein